MDRVASNGHLDVVKWLHANHSEGCTSEAMRAAVYNDHFDVLLFLHANRSEGCAPHVVDGTTCIKHLEIVQWLLATYPESVDLYSLRESDANLSALLDHIVHLHRPTCNRK